MPKPKILIIEDDRFLLKIYSDRLRREGFDVIGSITGIEGLSKAQSENPDVIILDIVLPGKNGFEVLSDLKLDQNTKNIPVIILSNLGQDSDVKKGLKLGAVTYLIKTEFPVSQLPGIIKKQLVKKEENRSVVK